MLYNNTHVNPSYRPWAQWTAQKYFVSFVHTSNLASNIGVDKVGIRNDLEIIILVGVILRIFNTIFLSI